VKAFTALDQSRFSAVGGKVVKAHRSIRSLSLEARSLSLERQRKP
jgi:hypothetical protein